MGTQRGARLTHSPLDRLAPKHGVLGGHMSHARLDLEQNSLRYVLIHRPQTAAPWLPCRAPIPEPEEPMGRMFEFGSIPIADGLVEVDDQGLRDGTKASRSSFVGGAGGAAGSGASWGCGAVEAT